MSYWYVLTELNGDNIGGVLGADERRGTFGLSGNQLASFKVRLDNPLASEITDRAGDVLLKIYDGTTLKFVGDLTTAEAIGAGWRLLISRENLINRAISLPSDISTADVRQADDSLSQGVRGLFEAVTPSDVGDAGMRQAWVNAQVQAKANPQLQVTLEPTASTEHTLSCNFAGPHWRLGKRLTGKSTIPLQPTNERAVIAWSLITAANLESDTGIRLGTLGTTISTTAGPWQYAPIAEKLTELSSVSSYAFEFTYLAQDRFGSVGPLAARVAEVGGTWEGAGDSEDFTGSAALGMERTAVSDSSITNGRYATLSNSITGAVWVQCDVRYNISFGAAARFGVLLRYADNNNWVMATMDPFSSPDTLVVRKCVAGTQTVLSTSNVPFNDQFYTIRFQVNAAGQWVFSFWQTWGDPGIPGALGAPLTGTDSDLATGGPLADGKVGIYDANTSATGVRREFDNFLAARAYTHRDEFGFTGGLSGRTSPIGGSWSGAGDADDFAGTGLGPTGAIGIQRTAVSDSSLDNGRYAILSTSVTGAVYAEIAQSFSAIFTGRMGVLIRYTDINNWLMGSVNVTGTTATMTVRKRVAGTITTLGSSTSPPLTSEFYKIRLQADAAGDWACWLWPSISTADPVAPILASSTADADLATAGALANGKVGVYDAVTSSGAVTRLYDTFIAAVPTQSMGWQTLDFEYVPEEPTPDTNEQGQPGVKIATFNAAQVIGTQKPGVILDGRPNGPGFGTAADEYDVGDTVTSRGIYNGISRFNGSVRVFKVDVSIDKNGKVTESPLLALE